MGDEKKGADHHLSAVTTTSSTTAHASSSTSHAPANMSQSSVDFINYNPTAPTFFDDLFYCGAGGSLFDLLNQPPPTQGRQNPAESSELLNAPAAATSGLCSPSVSSSSAEAPNSDLKDQHPVGDKGKEQLKVKKKKGQKREREARFAFITKSEVDQLDDGYRWRKYGQKAVKNSPFPRSYYRCTAGSCGVKKRVERSSSDPETVVTTYEGQHTHPCPLTPRATAHLQLDSANVNASPSSFIHQLYQNQHQSSYFQSLARPPPPPPSSLSFCETTSSMDGGLLEDMVPFPFQQDQNLQPKD